MPADMEVTTNNAIKVTLQMSLESIYLLRAQSVYLRETFDFQWKLSIAVLTASAIGVLALMVSFVAMLTKVFRALSEEWECKRMEKWMDQYTEQFVPRWVYKMNQYQEAQRKAKRSNKNAGVDVAESERDALLQVPHLQQIAGQVTKSMKGNRKSKQNY